jgi:hypothetical protein
MTSIVFPMALEDHVSMTTTVADVPVDAAGGPTVLEDVSVTK